MNVFGGAGENAINKRLHPQQPHGRPSKAPKPTDSEKQPLLSQSSETLKPVESSNLQVAGLEKFLDWLDSPTVDLTHLKSFFATMTPDLENGLERDMKSLQRMKAACANTKVQKAETGLTSKGIILLSLRLSGKPHGYPTDGLR